MALNAKFFTENIFHREEWPWSSLKTPLMSQCICLEINSYQLPQTCNVIYNYFETMNLNIWFKYFIFFFRSTKFRAHSVSRNINIFTFSRSPCLEFWFIRITVENKTKIDIYAKKLKECQKHLNTPLFKHRYMCIVFYVNDCYTR